MPPPWATISGRGTEPWHRIEAGGFLRNVVYGFNDGLTANFGLVAGVIGATVSTQYKAVVVAGVAGLIADALSMGRAASSPPRASRRSSPTRSPWSAPRSS